jgi:putative ABC transport system permease protein
MMRGLIRVPVLAATIVATVGLGIGGTTAIFAVMDAALLRPLPYPNPEQLVRIYTDTPPYKFRFSVADYQALEAQQTTFAQVAAYTDRSMAYSDGSTAERLRGRLVTWTYFDLLGLTPALGRNFTQAEGHPGGPRAVIVTNAFWRDRLGSRREAVGTAVRLDGIDYTLVGVLPPVLGPLERGQVFFVAAQFVAPRRKGPFFLITIGRLPAADRLSAASAELHAINKRIFPIWQSSYQDERATWGVMDLKTYLIGEFRPLARLAIAAVALVWLVACINASNLLLARVTSRRRELAVRTALGASRARVVGHLLSESALLAAAACAVGVALAWAGIEAARTIGAPYIPRADEIVLGGRTLMALGATTLLSAVMFGLIPAIHGAGGSVEEGLRSGSRSATGSRSARRLRGLLVAGQFAIATPLLVVAGLLIVSLSHLSRVNLGFDTHNVLTAGVTLPTAQYRDDGQVRTFWERLRSSIGSVPGVAAVGFTDARPPADANNQNNFDLEDYPAGPGRSQSVTTWVDVSPNYFELFGLTLVEGRLFDQRDTVTTAPSAVVVDQAWAKRFFPGRSAVGKRLKGGGCSTCDWTTVVGVVSVVKYDGLRAPDQGVVYTPMSESGEGLAGSQSGRSRYLIMRTTLSSEAVLPQIRRALRDIDPSLPLSSVATVDGLVEQSLDQPRGLSAVVGALALVALVLSVVGIYGVMAHYVQQQMKDISIRLALGGTPTNVLQLVVGRGMALVAWGVLCGIGMAFVLARMLSSLLFGVGAADPLTFTGVTAVMASAALAACAVPAARAASVEPAVVLRND